MNIVHISVHKNGIHILGTMTLYMDGRDSLVLIAFDGTKSFFNGCRRVYWFDDRLVGARE